MVSERCIPMARSLECCAACVDQGCFVQHAAVWFALSSVGRQGGQTCTVWRLNCDPHYSRNLTWASSRIYYFFPFSEFVRDARIPFFFRCVIDFSWRLFTVFSRLSHFNVYQVTVHRSARMTNKYGDVVVILITAETWPELPLARRADTHYTGLAFMADEYRGFLLLDLEVVDVFSHPRGIWFFLGVIHSRMYSWAKSPNVYGDLIMIPASGDIWVGLIDTHSFLAILRLVQGLFFSKPTSTDAFRCLIDTLPARLLTPFLDSREYFMCSTKYVPVNNEDNHVRRLDADPRYGGNVETWCWSSLQQKRDLTHRSYLVSVHFLRGLIFHDRYIPLVFVGVLSLINNSLDAVCSFFFSDFPC